MAKETKRKAPKRPAWTATWSGGGGESLDLEITNPGQRGQVLSVMVGYVEREDDGGWSFPKDIEPRAVFVNRVGELRPGPNRRRCLLSKPGGFVVESCYTGAPHLHYDEPGTYRLSISVGKKDLPPLTFEVREDGVYPEGGE